MATALDDLYDNEKERKQHESVILHLSREVGVPVEAVTRLYELELWKLKGTARVKDYLIVFAARRVKEAIREGERTAR